MPVTARIALVVLLILTGCTTLRQVSPPPTPVLDKQVYLPQVFKDYPQGYGVGGGLWGLSSEWYYHWSISPATSDARFVRMVWCLNEAYMLLNTPLIIAAAQADAASGAHRKWLVLNEPDGTFSSDQCGTLPVNIGGTRKVYQEPESIAARYVAVHDLITAHDTNATVFVGGILGLNSAASRDWWTRFVAELSRRGALGTIDGVHVHAYPRWSTGACAGWCMPELFAALDNWRAVYHDGLGLAGRPLWITETGAGPFCQLFAPFTGWAAVRDNVMLPFREWYAGQTDYTRAAWFVSWDGLASLWTCNYLIDVRVTPWVLTPLGVEWTN